jgi:hypothetical protein
LLNKRGATGISQVIGDWPEHHLGAGHERSWQLAVSNGIHTCLPQRMVPVEED